MNTKLVKFGWWFLVTGVVGAFLYFRIPAISGGTGTQFDIVLFLVFVALMLSPLFSEMEFFGLKLKREIENLKSDVRHEIGEVKTLITSIGITNSLHQHISLQPAPNAELAQMKEEFAKLQEARSKEVQWVQSSPIEAPVSVSESVPDDISYLFTNRYVLEKEVLRLWRNVAPCGDSPEKHTFSKRLYDLEYTGLISRQAERIIREIYTICSSAIHGNVPTKQQIEFVREVLPGILDTLNHASARFEK